MTRRWRLIAGIGSIAVAGVAVASLDRVREALDGSRSETDPVSRLLRLLIVGPRLQAWILHEWPSEMLSLNLG